MTSIILINLGNPLKRKENDLLRLLSVLLSTEISPNDKKGILEDKFKIPMSAKMNKEARVMCNLSDGIEQRGMEKGIKKGMEKGKSEMVLAMLKDNQPLELIAKFSNFTKEKIAEIGRKNGVAIG